MRAPSSARIEWWMRPAKDRALIHRIELEHGLYLANLKQDEIKATLADNFAAQTDALENISYSLDELRDTIAVGFSAVADGLSAVGEGVYQLHLDAVGTHARLDDILFCLVDKAGFQRELAARRARAEADRARYQASGEYADAMTLTKRALNDSDRAKAGAMLDEAIVLFERASRHPELALQASFQLGYLHHLHRQDLESAYSYYERALGPGYSAHYARTARHLAHLDYLRGRYDTAYSRLLDLVVHDDAITRFAADLAQVNDQPWPDCMDGLERTLASHAGLLERCGRLGAIREQFTGQRRFSGTERFKESYGDIVKELRVLRPDLQVYFEGARYAVKAGHGERATPWLKHVHDSQPNLNARRAFLLEAMSNEDLRHA